MITTDVVALCSNSGLLITNRVMPIETGQSNVLQAMHAGV